MSIFGEAFNGENQITPAKLMGLLNPMDVPHLRRILDNLNIWADFINKGIGEWYQSLVEMKAIGFFLKEVALGFHMDFSGQTNLGHYLNGRDQYRGRNAYFFPSCFL